ncbi:MAG: hypothetical protein EXR54_08110 [Dehalococcoidia bacterium]|nr:hypothetical protein [Dehalococcoidia bacterium]MSQ17504.1 hypothetical protein [Dehalococcoidia bacterium]
MLEKIYAKLGDFPYLVFRVLVGFTWAEYGFRMLLGQLGGYGGPFAWEIALTALIELAAGLAVAFGWFTRLAASISALGIAWSYSMAYLGNVFLAPPVGLSGGTGTALLFGAFLVMMIHDSGKWGLERLVMKKEAF